MLNALPLPTRLRQHQSRFLNRRLHGWSLQCLLLDNCLLYFCLSMHADRFRVGQDDRGWPLHSFQYALRLYRRHQYRYRRRHSNAPGTHDMVFTIIEASKARYHWGIFSRWLVRNPLKDKIPTLSGPANVRPVSASPASFGFRLCSSLTLVTQLVSFGRPVPCILVFSQDSFRYRLRCCHVV